jgi:hypothetical protein
MSRVIDLIISKIFYAEFITKGSGLFLTPWANFCIDTAHEFGCRVSNNSCSP